MLYIEVIFIIFFRFDIIYCLRFEENLLNNGNIV